MPPYSRKYRLGRQYYRQYKMMSNPLNRGYWDLKHWWGKKYDRQFYNSIKVKVTLKNIVFDTTYKPDYMRDIYYYVSKYKILGMTKKQFRDEQMRNKIRVRPKAIKIIDNG